MGGELASWFFCVLKIKVSACLFFGGVKENHTSFLEGGSSGEERVISPVPRFRAPVGLTLGLLDLVCRSQGGGIALAS